MNRVLLTVVLVTASYAFALRPSIAGTSLFWWGIALPYVPLVALALYKMWDDGTLVEKLFPRWGDLSIGMLTAALLLLCSWAARSILAPAGSDRQAWVFHIYLQLGDPDVLQRSVLLTSLLVAIAAAEEIVWRGMVLTDLNQRLGERTGWIATAALYGLCALPTLYTLRDTSAGLNPLLVTAALGCGLVWTFTAARARRLMPVIFSHAFFTYLSAVQFRLPGL
jgi:membrane protease YdiL (CAAX protease family)